MSQPKLHRPAKTFEQLAENLLNGAFVDQTWMECSLLTQQVWLDYGLFLSIATRYRGEPVAITVCSDAEHASMYALFIGQFFNKE